MSDSEWCLERSLWRVRLILAFDSVLQIHRMDSLLIIKGGQCILTESWLARIKLEPWLSSPYLRHSSDTYKSMCGKGVGSSKKRLRKIPLIRHWDGHRLLSLYRTISLVRLATGLQIPAGESTSGREGWRAPET